MHSRPTVALFAALGLSGIAIAAETTMVLRSGSTLVAVDSRAPSRRGDGQPGTSEIAPGGRRPSPTGPTRPSRTPPPDRGRALSGSTNGSMPSRPNRG